MPSSKFTREQLLRQWPHLNAALRSYTTSAEVVRLLRVAVKARTRLQVRQRIYSRFSKLRAAEELALLNKGKLPGYLK